MTHLEKLKALLAQFQAAFKNSQQRAVTNINDIVTRVASKGEANVYGWLAQFPTFKKWTGARQRNAMKAAAYSLVNDTYTLDMQIPKEKLDDDTLGLYQPMVENMGVEAAAHDGDLVTQAILAGLTNSAAGKCYDGKPFFHTEHYLEFDEDGVGIETGAKFSNILTDPDNPDAPYWIAGEFRKPIRPFLLQDRQAPEFISRTALTDENVYSAREFEFSIDKRVAVGFTIPQLAVACNYPLTQENFEKVRVMIQGMKGTEGKKKLGLDVSHVLVGLEHNAAAEDLFDTQINTQGGRSKYYGKVAIKYLPELS